jgi:hypothetical protein
VVHAGDNGTNAFLTLTIANANLKDAAESSVACSSLLKVNPRACTSPGLQGFFAKAPSIVSVEALNPSIDQVYAAGDQILITFDTDTDGGGQPDKKLAVAAAVNALLKPSLMFATAYSAVWTPSREGVGKAHALLITVEEVGPLQQSVNGLSFSFQPSLSPIRVAERNSAPAAGTSPALTGSFKAPPFIKSIEARNPKGDMFYAAGDEILVTFSYPTNKGKAVDLSNKEGVDQLFTFSQGLGIHTHTHTHVHTIHASCRIVWFRTDTVTVPYRTVLCRAVPYRIVLHRIVPYRIFPLLSYRRCALLRGVGRRRASSDIHSKYWIRRRQPASDWDTDHYTDGR